MPASSGGDAPSFIPTGTMAGGALPIRSTTMDGDALPFRGPCATMDGDALPLPSKKAETYTVGQIVEVWSSTKMAWILADVMVVARGGEIVDGYECEAGTIKVFLVGGGEKYVTFAAIATNLRKKGSSDPHEILRPQKKVFASMKVKMCKNFCGRSVQPGLTRNGHEYETCCRTCGKTGGKGQHDLNCGGWKPAAAHECDLKFSPKAEIAKMLKDDQYIRSKVFSEVDELKNLGGSLNVLEAADALAAVMDQFSGKGVKALVPLEPDFTNKFQSADLDKDGRLKDSEFIAFVRGVYEEHKKAWFRSLLPTCTSLFCRLNPHALETVYDFDAENPIGAGSFGVVYEATHKISGSRRVCKRLRIEGLQDSKEALAEIASMARLDHPNVIKVFEYFDDGKYISQILEACRGGELQEKVAMMGSDENHRNMDYWPYESEAFIVSVIKQTLRALAFMHGQQPPVVHKDLKPQNIMLVASDERSDSIKVIDFGLAEVISDTYAKEVGGTLLYMAPEVFQKKISPKVDVWSTGIILYNLITGDFPFLAEWRPPRDQNSPEFREYQTKWEGLTQSKIETEDVKLKLNHPRMRKASGACIACMVSMLNKDAAQRPTAAGCLQHEWFRDSGEEVPTLSVGTVQNIEAFARMSDLKKSVVFLLAHEVSAHSENTVVSNDPQQRAYIDPRGMVFQELRSLFTHFDKENKGSLDDDTLRGILIKGGVASIPAERIVHALDINDNGDVGWTEFLAAAAWKTFIADKLAVEAAYEAFDENKTGEIKMEYFAGLFATDETRQRWMAALPDMMPSVQEEVDEGIFRRAVQRICCEEKKKKTKRKLLKITKEVFYAWVSEEVIFVRGDELFAV